MKKLFLFLAMASTTMFVSCGSDDSDSTPVVPPIEAEEITLTASLPAIEVGQSVTFTVTNDLAENVTATSTFTANNVAFTGPTFTPTEAGVFTIVAKNGDLTSLPVAITVTDPVVPSLNSMVYNGTDIDVTKGDMIYWGAYYTDETQTEIVEIFALATHDGDLSVASPDNVAFVDFTMPYSETEAATPVAGSYNWLSPFTDLRAIQLKVDGSPIEIATEDFNSVSVTIDAIEFLGAGNLTMTYSTDASFGTSTLTTSGEGGGKIYDASARPARQAKKEVFNIKKFNEKKAQFLASKTKKLMK